MPARPPRMGLTNEEIRRIDRQAITGVLLCYSPLIIYFVLAVLNGWPI